MLIEVGEISRLIGRRPVYLPKVVISGASNTAQPSADNPNIVSKASPNGILSSPASSWPSSK
jgi:hypothetical protein